MPDAVECEVAEWVCEGELRRAVQGRSSWQWVIHGDTGDLRELAAEAIYKVKGLDAAKSYVLCGRGDEMRTDGRGQFRIIPRGCGERTCPRCSRKRGVKFLRKIEGHLSAAPHERLYHVVLTQRVEQGERFWEAGARFEVKWRQMRRWLGRTGMVAALATVHVNWSRRGGWHYHMHLLAESKVEWTRELVIGRWQEFVCEEDGGSSAGPGFLRMVAKAGPALEDLKASAGQTELWQEAQSEIARALQYPIRDILSGVSAWTLALADADRMVEFVRESKGMQTHRTYGKWRMAVRTEEEDAKDDDDERRQAVVDTSSWVSLGTLDEMRVAARGGASWCVAAVLWLEEQTQNRSAFGKRMVDFCRAVIPF